ncbi:MAG: hypothetical protein HY902_03470 [Deltaproteobacteria bacterium]|nr:hypothetical protein [Deltaproteobacteria bacterium]
MHLLFGVALLAPLYPAAPAEAWSARKPAPGGAKHRPAPRTAKPPAAEVALVERCRAAATRTPPKVDELLAILRAAMAARETACGRDMVDRLLLAKASPAQLIEAGQLLATDPLGLPVWKLAWQGARRRPLWVRQIGEGYADALLALGDAEAARVVVEAALGQTPAGTRRGLYERAATIARLQGKAGDVADELSVASDPDAQVVAAQLMVELGRDDDATATLRKAWQRYPGHRALQAAFMQLLQRLGVRDELRALVDQVVRLAPADPMPLLSVLDAHIAARDTRAARALIDEMARRWPNHDQMLESLIDREQRLGDDPTRIRALYEQLLIASRQQPQYLLAYAEWLLSHGDSRGAQAVLVRRPGKGEPVLEGLIRQAQLLIGHRMVVESREPIERAVALAPSDPRVLRLQAQQAELEKNNPKAEAVWLGLTKLGDAATPTDRRRAADARQALVGLWRRIDVLAQRTDQLAAELQNQEPTLGKALLWLDSSAQLDEGASVPTSTLATLLPRLRSKLGPDPELLAALASLELSRSHDEEVVAYLLDLRNADPDAAEPLLQQALEHCLARGRRDLAATLEEALAGLGQSAAGLLKLGDLHLRYGDVAGATALFKRAAQSERGDTRATARLAAMFRKAGEVAEEEAALRDIVVRTADADELESAGQRLITVALARGSVAELVRWLDAVAPQHPRREILARLRSSAHDAWLRTASLDGALGRPDKLPPSGDMAQALASGDLALQVRALREMALQHRMIAPSLAKSLLQSPNLVLRRDTALALGSAGVAAAAELLRDVMAEGSDRDEDVVAAQLAALAQLPAVTGVEAAVLPLINRGDPLVVQLAQLVTGAKGSSAAAPSLMVGIQTPRRDGGAAPIMALGALVGRNPSDPSLASARALLLDRGERLQWASSEIPRNLAIMWALRASGLQRSGALLLRTAVQSDSLLLRRAAVVLLARRAAPEIRLQLPEIGDPQAMVGLRLSALRNNLAEVLAGGEAEVAVALGEVAPQLRPLVEQQAALDPAWRARWCASWPTEALAQPSWSAVCPASP